MAELYFTRAVSDSPAQDYQCPVCGCVLDYTASSEDYHRYECACGTKLLVPKGGK